MTEETLEAYCLKCRTKVPLVDPVPAFNKKGQPITRGRCPQCGTALTRPGRTPAHENLPPPDPPERSGKLVIVESPAKARTVGRFLGKGYKVEASIGHVRDLLRSRLSVDVEDNFKPQYRVPNEKKAVVKKLAQEAEKAEEIYLATDPDREGEAIAWHLLEAAKIDPSRARRVVFHEITREAIEEAFAHPRGNNQNLVNAQQARRILDRLVGYQISPLLWERVRNRTTAGRVQSVAVRLIVEREREIQAFVPQEYWSINAELAKHEEPPRSRKTFIARLVRVRGAEVDLKNEAETRQIVEELERSLYRVAEVKRGQRKRRPSPPFTTSTMQQEASRRLGFTAKRTMAVAQALYEGIPLGDKEGPVGLITYMRTDSVHVAEVAQREARQFIQQVFGESYLPPRPPVYKTKVKGAQEAHEAIRPTSVFRTPEKVRPYLNRDQFRLYELIWKRFVASQMAPAELDTLTVDIHAGPSAEQMPYLFRVSGSTVRFPGFLAVYEEARDEDAAPAEGESPIDLPPLANGDPLDLIRVLPEQHFTQPPPRYTEAALVRALEERGIGRPSTYAPIISTIQARGYVERVDRRLVPTQLGMIVNDLLVEHFPDIVDYDFTARMEEDLDRIAAGEVEWVPVLKDFYAAFSQELEKARRTMQKVELDESVPDEVCEQCGSSMVIKYGRFGKFLACSNYPACKNTRSYAEKVGVRCPECGGDLVKRRTRRGRTFYGCSNYPACSFTIWKEPLSTACPQCGGLLVVDRKGWAKCYHCQEEFEIDSLPVGEAVSE
ncbi:MAG: type I DNA topoisomerase [Anaerolineae bacterium]